MIDGEAGNDEPDFGVDDADAVDANPVVVVFPLPSFPPSAADERCESRRMSEDMVSR